MSSFRHTCAVATGISLLASTSHGQTSDLQVPCEAYSQSAAVFVGTAAAPVRRQLQFPDQPPFEMTLTPMIVERAYFGVATPVMYLTPAGVERYATPGRRYLVYGREYQPPDIVMASPGYGAKEIERAAEDLAFLDALMQGAAGGTITGIVQQKNRAYDGATNIRGPLEGILVRIFNEGYSTAASSSADGRFVVSGIPAGQYQLVPQLPEGLVVWDSTSQITTLVRDGGCATKTIDVLFNGRVRGVLRGPDGRPLRSTSVDLMPLDLKPDPTGHIIGSGSVSTNDNGEFEFAGRPAGRYYLGVSLFNAPNPHGPSYPRTYYPGTTDRSRAVPIIVEHARGNSGFDFSIPAVLPKGELEVIVESANGGELKLCFVQLADPISRRSTWSVQAGVPHKIPVVAGQRYQVHVHEDSPGGHLESEPYVLTATTGTTVVTLRPDAPRILHR